MVRPYGHTAPSGARHGSLEMHQDLRQCMGEYTPKMGKGTPMSLRSILLRSILPEAPLPDQRLRASIAACSTTSTPETCWLSVSAVTGTFTPGTTPRPSRWILPSASMARPVVSWQ